MPAVFPRCSVSCDAPISSASCSRFRRLTSSRKVLFAHTKTTVVEEELTNDENAKLMELPLSLVPILVVLAASSHLASPSADDILASVGKLVHGGDKHDRVIQAAQEVARAGGGELHNISALTGGMVAQEVIKVITKQYIPIDNTCVFDGIGSRCQVFRL